uniref:Uncharacterized protein n=1 Tax=Anguilla anguilla TaxID=7936 RepID=A0A0E9RZ82_ANGAN
MSAVNQSSSYGVYEHWLLTTRGTRP